MSIKPEKLAVARSFAKELNETMLDDCIDLPHLVHANAHRASTIIERLCFEIEQLQATQAKWISVDDPPKDTSPVLIRYLHSSGLHLCAIGSYLKKLGVWDTDMGFALEQITHWMPLPEAPKEEL